MCMAYPDAWVSQCAGKRRYMRSHDGNRAARHAMATLGGPAMVTYRCGWCGAWHVGHPSSFKIARLHRQLDMDVA